MALINSTQISAEMKASYNEKYKQEATVNGSSKVITFWYLDDNGFPRATKNLLAKQINVGNCGLMEWTYNLVYVLDQCNNDKAIFRLGNGSTYECSLKKVNGTTELDLNFTSTGGNADKVAKYAPAGTADRPVYIASDGTPTAVTLGQKKVASLPATTEDNMLYYVVP